ncbi:MAG: hypothetical protein KGI78_04020 [Patescibacteria group bacterium]|nr:hypothetical protein [Patescibacteria group bacterium]MDE1943885.1 hypothetical protein [Patescibacteria group bacterium]MDE1944963.1 hypothetical protein [Patescibacteria group bacterium]MDE2057986.1 hypothetical protein [Patescibacteria group bacterium]
MLHLAVVEEPEQLMLPANFTADDERDRIVLEISRCIVEHRFGDKRFLEREHGGRLLQYLEPYFMSGTQPDRRRLPTIRTLVASEIEAARYFVAKNWGTTGEF